MVKMIPFVLLAFMIGPERFQEVPPIPEIPLTAWQQSGIVVLFVLLIILLSTGVFAFIRFMLKWVTDREVEWQKLAKEREASWQQFIKDLRDEERANRAHDKSDSDSVMFDMQQALKSIANTLLVVSIDLKDHDIQAKDIQKVVGYIEQNTRPLPGEPGFVDRRRNSRKTGGKSNPAGKSE